MFGSWGPREKMWPRTHKKQQRLVAVRGRDRERQGNKEVTPAGLTLWTSQRDRLHNWPQFSPLPVSTTLALRLCSFPHFHGESVFSHSLTLILVRGLTLANGTGVHMTHKGSHCPCHHQENLPQLTCQRSRRGSGSALQPPSASLLMPEHAQLRSAELVQPPRVWAKSVPAFTCHWDLCGGLLHRNGCMSPEITPCFPSPNVC